MPGRDKSKNPTSTGPGVYGHWNQPERGVAQEPARGANSSSYDPFGGGQPLNLTKQGGGGNKGKLAGPGRGVNFIDENLDWFTQPTNIGDYWNRVQGQFNQPGGGATNRAEEWYQQFKGQIPNLPQDAGLAGYYDEAKRRTSEDINNQFAARGMFGSSAATDTLGEAFQGLDAEMANRRADFQLRKAAEDRAWQGLGGNLARGADISSAAQSADDLSWLTAGGQLAGAADSADLARVLGGVDAATTAQQLYEGRRGDEFNRTFALNQLMSGQYGDAVNALLAGDEQLLSQIIELTTGKAAEDYASSERTAEKGTRDFVLGAEMGSNLLSDIIPFM